MTAHAPMTLASYHFPSSQSTYDLMPFNPCIVNLVDIHSSCMPCTGPPFSLPGWICFSLSLCAWFRLFNTILLCPWLFAEWLVSICIHYSSQDKTPCTHGANAIFLRLTSFETPYSKVHNAMFELTSRSIKPQKKPPRSTLSAVYPMLPTNL
jgi:hypothetical protein